MSIGDKVQLVGSVISIDKNDNSCLVLIDAEDAYNVVKMKLSKVEDTNEDDGK